MRVLVVDDDPVVCRGTARMLSGAEVCCVRSAAEALTLLDAGNPFDIILSDMMMPESTGADLHGFIAACFPEMTSRFVMISGGTAVAELRPFAEKVGCPYVTKPLSREKLENVLLKVLAQKLAQTE
jgi:CheY-like chemotaxis protein